MARVIFSQSRLRILRQDVGKTFRAGFGVGLEMIIFPLIPKNFRVDTTTCPTKRVLSSNKELSLPIAAIFQPNNEFQTRNLKTSTCKFTDWEALVSCSSLLR
jgi:hypothetical protein